MTLHTCAIPTAVLPQVWFRGSEKVAAGLVYAILTWKIDNLGNPELHMLAFIPTRALRELQRVAPSLPASVLSAASLPATRMTTNLDGHTGRVSTI